MLSPSADEPPIDVIARLPESLLPQDSKVSEDGTDPRTIVALRQGLHFLTTFHPELTRDDRFHEYFVKECVLSRMT
jgi:5'-phosphate synthase pdxT subunit